MDSDGKMPHQNTASLASSPSDDLTRLAFSICGNPGVYAILVGSGLSRAAGIPTGWEITLDLVRRFAVAQGEPEQEDWLSWYVAKHGKEPSYSDLIEHLGSSSEERRAILHAYIEPTDNDLEEGRKVPTKAHGAIADLVHAGFVRVILTTNFDRLLENALRERGTEPTVVDSVDALKGAEPIAHSKCYLVKLHGDYKDARILNTDAELSKYDPEYDALLDRILDEHGLVVCGWSGEWDVALRSAITRSPSRRYSLFWAAREARGDVAEKIIAHRRGHVVQIKDADDFLGMLRDQVQTLSKTQRRDTNDIGLLVNSTKRFVAKPEYRIELHDLLESELQRLLLRLRNETPHVWHDAEGIRRRVAFYESATEPLARMVGVLGRWGDDTQHDAVVNALSSLVSQAQEERSGVTLLLDLRTYPAVIVLWAYGIALTLAKRWRNLHGVLSHRIDDRDYGQPRRVVEMLVLWSWRGGRKEIWESLPELERHFTPLSDHLFEVFDGWRISFAPVVADFEGLYDTWEILAALAYCETHSADELADRSHPAYAPVGRNGWRNGGRSHQRILDDLQSRDLRRDLAAAGFGAGQEEWLPAAAGNYARFVATSPHGF